MSLQTSANVSVELSKSQGCSNLGVAIPFDNSSLNFDVSELKLSSKQLSILRRHAQRNADDILQQNVILSNPKVYDDNYQDFVNDIYSTLYNFRIQRLETEFGFLIKEYFSLVQPLINKIHRLKQKKKDFTSQGVKNNRKSPEYEEYKKINKELIFSKDNDNFAERYFNLFKKTGILKYLEKSVNVRKSALSYVIKAQCNNCGFEEHLRRYDSNDRFDSFSNEKKMKKKRSYIYDSLVYLDKLGKTYSFLTLTYNNVSFADFEKTYFTDKKEGLNKVVKEFMRYKFKENDIIDYELKLKNGGIQKTNALDWQHLIGSRINEVYSGYYGVLEIKYNDGSSEYYKDFNISKNDLERIRTKSKDTFHPHIHFIMMRDKPKSRNDKTTGFIPKGYLQTAHTNVSQKFGNSSIRGSKILDIGAKNLKSYYKDKKFNAVSYILQYVTKGIHATNDEAFEKILYETSGVRFERSAGDLSAKNQKRMHAIIKFMASCRNGDISLNPCSFNGVHPIWKFNISEFYSMFDGKKGCSCLFCTHGIMQFKGVSDEEYITDLDNPLRLKQCLTNLGVDTTFIKL